MTAGTSVRRVVEPLAATAASPRRFRIAVFSYGLPCPGQKRGGIEQVAHDLANALVDRGHRVTVFTYDPRPASARYETGPLPARSFVMTWLGRRIAMGYVGNLLALGPGYRDFDVIVAHGDSLLLPLSGRPIVRVMHGSALEEARSATSIGRALFQAGVYAQELLTALLQRGTVAVSANTRRLNPFIRRTIPDGIDLRVFRPNAAARSLHPSILFVGALKGRKRGAWLLDVFERDIRPAFPQAELHMVTTPGPAREGVTYHTGIETDALVRLYQYAWVYASPSTVRGLRPAVRRSARVRHSRGRDAQPGQPRSARRRTLRRLPADADFAGAICGLLADAGERGVMARQGLAHAAEYDIAHAAALYERLIGELTTPGSNSSNP